MKALNRLALRCVLFTCALLVLSLGQANADDQHPRVRLSTTFGDIVLELDREKAPKTVENFLGYVQEGYYDGTIFHRVIDGFMAQGGGFTQDFQKKPTHAPIENEADNGLKNLNGTIAMARTNDPQSATAQFFINVADNGFLDYQSPTPRGWGYAVFGKVVEGMDVVDKIRRTPTGSGGPFRSNLPRTTIVIERASLDMAAPAAPSGLMAPMAE
jgi:cyclophilin family peptidyl-prolyl cis-trans isomerase